MPSGEDPDNYVEKFIAVGIDFGTTYTGVSWALSTDPTNISSITDWPSKDHLSQGEIQVPTLYDVGSQEWGYEITPDMTPIKWFKLLLLNIEDLKKEAGGNSTQVKETLDIIEGIGRDITPIEIVGLYLKKVWDHTYSALKSRIYVDNMPLRVAITVPAIWPPYAKDAMKKAADLAGITKHRAIGETTLITVEEPEAAALASVFQREDCLNIKENESFVVCDAGGGTIDVISYKLASEKPFKLQECVPGKGKLAGAFLIDQGFFAHLKGKAKLKMKSVKTRHLNDFILRDWEFGAKRSFSTVDEGEPYNLRPPSEAYGPVDRLFNKDSLAISRDDMAGFFNRSLTGIRYLVGEQCKQVRSTTGEDPKRILLVGGLGGSEYIYNALNQSFETEVFRPRDRWSAVATGAVLRVLQENIASQEVNSLLRKQYLTILPDVVSHCSRYHYGILVIQPISSLVLDSEDVVLTNPEGIKGTLRMTWYLSKGEEVDKERRIPIRYYQTRRESEPLPPKCSFQILYCEEDKAPKRQTATVLPLCRIDCEWDKPITEWKKVGPPSAGWRKHDDLELTMGLQGEPKWMIRVGTKKQEHRFNIEYIGGRARK